VSKQVAGHKDFKAIAVATDIKPAASPCGMCRQLYASILFPIFFPFLYQPSQQRLY